METIVVEREDGIVRLTLNRPEKKNAINAVMFDELLEAFREIGARAEDRALVITGAGDGFCTGADLTDAGNATAIAAGRGASVARMRHVHQAAIALHEMPKPVVAAVNGVAAGAGASLALGCDLIVASEQARFSMIFVRRGLMPDFGATWLLPRLVGMHRAKELALLGDVVSAKEAADMGLVNRLVPHGDLLTTAMDLARRAAASAPVAVGLTKRALAASYGASFAEQLETEAVGQALAFTTADAAEALTAFVEKREPRFTGQ